MKIRQIVWIWLFSPLLLLAATPSEVETIQQTIEQQGAGWAAAENWITRLTPEERRLLCGAEYHLPAVPRQPVLQLQARENLPMHFDWRDHQGNWITPVKDQGQCGSCVAFAAAGGLEAWWRIHHADLDSVPDLSEQFMLSCSDMTCNDGWRTDLAFDFLTEIGLPPESCLPYTASDATECAAACEDWQDSSTRIPGWGYVTWTDGNVENIKNAVYLAPVIAAFVVYEDFFSYSRGVYEHVYGTEQGGHAIVIIGWDDATRSWICKNSWNTNWGEDGYFQIRWGQCSMDQGVIMIYDNLTDGPASSIFPASRQVAATIGDRIQTDFMLGNPTANPLQYAAFSFEIDEIANFHRSDFLVSGDSSWWNGDEETGGYRNGWLQNLDTPVLDLSSAAAPNLTFWLNYALENPAGASAPYDGWDGCNIWGSVDGGQTYTVLHPINLPYTCSSLYSFGEADEGWGMGAGIAGWAGTSNGWQMVMVDLEEYRVERAKFRFCFASDMGYCTLDDRQLFGTCIKDIQIFDGSTFLFDDSRRGDEMQVSNSSKGTTTASWIKLRNGAGVIAPEDSSRVIIDIDTRDLEPTAYRAEIRFISNHTSQAITPFRLELNLQKPTHDLAIGDIHFSEGNCHLYGKSQIGVQIDNCGLSAEEDIEVIASIVTLDQTLLVQDTLRLQRIESDSSAIGFFKPFIILSSETHQCLLQLQNGSAVEYNTYNDSDTLSFVATNLVTDFEDAYQPWECQGGWGITDKLNRHSGSYMAHVDNGQMPYSANMNGMMHYRRPFYIQTAQALTLSYWARWGTETGHDVCYLEVSSDSLNWSAVDSVSGNGPRSWTQRAVDLTHLLGETGAKLWIRFHFISDESGVGLGLGVLIDDIEIFADRTTSAEQSAASPSLPTGFAMAQNYPNPFNAVTRIRYQLGERTAVSLRIVNLLGQEMAVLVNEVQRAGEHSVVWNGMTHAGVQAPSGIYLYQLDAGQEQLIRKMVYIR